MLKARKNRHCAVLLLGVTLLAIVPSSIVESAPIAGPAPTRPITASATIRLAADKSPGQTKGQTPAKEPDPTVKIEFPLDEPGRTAAAMRAPVPAPDAIKSGKAIVQEVFGAELAAAKAPAKKLPVIKKMLDYAQQEKGAPAAEVYVLLDQARELAIAAGDVSMAIQAIEALNVAFNVDGGALKSQALTTLSDAATSPTQHKAVAQAALAVFERALEDDDFNVARQSGGLALSAARKGKDESLAKTITERAKYFKAVQAAHEKVPAALKTLETNPKDPSANLTVGRYYCLVKRNWKRGLPLLLQGSDSALQQLAKQELDGDQGNDVRIQLADGWWQRGEQDVDFKGAVEAHAADIYREVLPSLTGLSKLKIEKRLEAMPATAAGPTSSPGAGTSSTPSVAAERDEMWKKIQEQVKANQVTRTKTVGFTLGKTPFAVIPGDGAMLVGFDLSIGGRGVEAVCPLFQRRGGNLAGDVVGKPTPGRIIRVAAKKGYAVASIKVKGGLWVDGMSVTFMEIRGQGLDPATAYTSPWYGSTGGTHEAVLGDNTIVVGIHGNGNPGELSAIGLVQLGDQSSSK